MYGRYQPFAEQRNEIHRIADAVGRKYSHRRLATRRDPPNGQSACAAGRQDRYSAVVHVLGISDGGAQKAVIICPRRYLQAEQRCRCLTKYVRRWIGKKTTLLFPSVLPILPDEVDVNHLSDNG